MGFISWIQGVSKRAGDLFGTFRKATENPLFKKALELGRGIPMLSPYADIADKVAQGVNQVGDIHAKASGGDIGGAVSDAVTLGKRVYGGMKQ